MKHKAKKIGGRPVTIFAGQFASNPFPKFAEMVAGWGADGIELCCWGGYFDPIKAAGVTIAEFQAELTQNCNDTKAAALKFLERSVPKADLYCMDQWEVLTSNGLTAFAVSDHLIGQLVCDPIDQRHAGIASTCPEVWGTKGIGAAVPGDKGYDADEAEAIKQRAAIQVIITGIGARRFMNLKPGASADDKKKPAIVNGFTCAGQECWPLFEGKVGHVPCYVMSRRDAEGQPIVCEGDGNGAWTQVAAQAASNTGATMHDINHSIPADLLEGTGVDKSDVVGTFHCGRTCKAYLKEGACLKFQVIMASLMPKDITYGTMEGALKPGPVTIVRVHHHPAPPEFGGGKYQAFITQGEILDVDPSTFGGTAVVKIKGFEKFYREVLIERGFPHHAILAFSHCGQILKDAFTMMGIDVFDSNV